MGTIGTVKDETGATVLEVDFSDMEKRITESLKQSQAQLLKSVQESVKAKPQGNGIVEAMKQDERANVLEYFENIHSPHGKVHEQWTIVVPVATQYELAGHLRDYVFVSDVVKGKPGETVKFFSQYWS